MATRCASCSYSLSVSDSVACYECSSYFHIDCAQLVGFSHYELSSEPSRNTFRCSTCVLLPLPTRECDSDSGSDCDMPSRQQDYDLETHADITKDMSEVKGAVQDLSNLCKDMLREINEIKSINLTLRCGIENLRHENEERDKLIVDLKHRLDYLESNKKTDSNNVVKSNLCSNVLKQSEEDIIITEVSKAKEEYIITGHTAQERTVAFEETTCREEEKVITSEVTSLYTEDSKENRQDWTWKGRKAVELETSTETNVQEENVTEESETEEEVAHGWETLQEELKSEYKVKEEVVFTSKQEKVESFNVHSEEEIVHSEYETEDESLIEKELHSEEEIECSEKEDISEGEAKPLFKASNVTKEKQIEKEDDYDDDDEEDEEEEGEQEKNNTENIKSFQDKREVEEKAKYREVEDEEVEHREITKTTLKEDVILEAITQEQAFSTESSSNYLDEKCLLGSGLELNQDETESINSKENCENKTTELCQLKSCDSCEEDEEEYENETNSTLEEIRQDDFIEVEVGEIPEEGDNEELILREEDKEDVENTEVGEDGYRSELGDHTEEACEEEDGSHRNGEQILENRLDGEERLGESHLDVAEGETHLDVAEGETGVEGEQRLGGQSLEDGEVQPCEPPPTPPPQHTEEDLWLYLREAVTSEHPSTVEEFLQNLIGTLQHVPEEYLQPVIEANIKRATSPTVSTDGEPLHTLEGAIEKEEAVLVEGAAPLPEETATAEETSQEPSSQFAEESATAGDADGYSAVEAAA